MIFNKRSQLKDLKKIPTNDLSIIAKKLNEYKEDPFSHCKELTGKNISTFRFKIGNYRAVFDFDSEFVVIHRKINFKPKSES